MQYEQVRPFSQSQGGKTANLCLANVTAGFGIPNKYASAWIAWQHTQQHTDRNIPIGLAVPIFYSYSVDLGNGLQNYGHINVQLPNGTVWSDGNIYASIDDYTSKKLPKFVGWGESVNDVIVIQGEPEMIWNNGDTYNLLNLTVSTAVANEAQAANYVGYFGLQGDGQHEFKAAFYEIIGSPQYAYMVRDAHAGTPNATVLAPGNYTVN